MPVPSFNLDGVIPPYLGINGPGGPRQLMSPYKATSLEVVQALGTTTNRRDILRKWLDHREQLRLLSFADAFQWIDGSFVENKEPNDIDTVLFFEMPPLPDRVAVQQFRNLVAPLLSRAGVKNTYRIDLLIVELSGTPGAVVDLTRYYLGLFSHRRGDDLWKGMLEVQLDTTAEDQLALLELNLMDAADV